VLHKHRSRPLILLVAAAGFGKSTLAAAYARESGGAVAWLTVSEADRDPRRLFTRLADSLEAGFELPGSVPELRRGLDEGADGVGLARLLLDDLSRAPAGFIIVLDDFHLVDESEDVVSAVDALIRDLPEAGQVVITTREAPALSMTRYVVEGSVFPVGTEDLRFSQDETRRLRQKIRESDPFVPTDEDARARREADEALRDDLAEGWVAGILLGGAPRQLGFGGGTLLGGYVEEKVLARLLDTEQAWLESLSVFEVITPRAAERLFGAGPWRTRLLSLTERCPFLVAGQDGTYRLHGLVRDTVLQRFRRRSEERWREAWTAARELAQEAPDPVGFVRACQELGEVESAVEVVRTSVRRDVQAGRWNAVLVTLAMLPEPFRRTQPDLTLIEARALSNTGHPDPAREAAEEALHYGGRTGDVVVQISALIELATVTYPIDVAASEDWLAAAEHILRTSTVPQNAKRPLEGGALRIRGICATLRGNVVEARQAFENAERLLSLGGPSRDLALVQQNYGTFCSRVGDFATARHALDAAAAHCRLMTDHLGLASAQTVLGDLDLRLGLLEAAGVELNEARKSASAVGALRMEAHAIVSLGQWHRASGRIEDAVESLDKGIAAAEEIVERELLALALAQRAEAALLQGQPGAARQLLARAQSEGQLAGSSAMLAVVDRALGRLNLHDGAASSAISYLESALRRGGDIWSPDERAETHYWMGTAYLMLKRVQPANACLERAVALAVDADLPAMLARPVAEDPRLLDASLNQGLHTVFLGKVSRLAATRRPWSGAAPGDEPRVIVRNDLPRLEVQLFGSFRMHCEGELIGKPSRKDRARELAALLILHPDGLPDAEIGELMFPEKERESAQHNLQMSVYKLRSDLGKAAIQLSARTYQLNPQLPLDADVREFDAALARARGAVGEARLQHLTHAIELYRGPLAADAGWQWLEPIRLEYRHRFVEASLQLAEALAPVDSRRSDQVAEALLLEAPESDLAYECLINTARRRGDVAAVRRLLKRYSLASEQFGFAVNPVVVKEPGPARAAR
jgi:LuxR family maltose regulon positive regulatory protein